MWKRISLHSLELKEGKLHIFYKILLKKSKKTIVNNESNDKLNSAFYEDKNKKNAKFISVNKSYLN